MLYPPSVALFTHCLFWVLLLSLLNKVFPFTLLSLLHMSSAHTPTHSPENDTSPVLRCCFSNTFKHVHVLFIFMNESSCSHKYCMCCQTECLSSLGVIESGMKCGNSAALTDSYFTFSVSLLEINQCLFEVLWCAFCVSCNWITKQLFFGF